MQLYKISLLRRMALPFLKLFEHDVNITHPWVPSQRIRLNSFRHKGYWYHGKNRERNSMGLFRKFIKPGETIVEVGGHIGFISTFFSYLTGSAGKVFVFEPGLNNLPYIRENISSTNNVFLIEKAVGAENSTAEFYEDSLTGQNNSLVRDFQGFKRNAEFAYVASSIQSRQVPVVALDSVFQTQAVDFIKIDVEGFEWGVLSGATQVVESNCPILMVEVQANEEEIFSFLKERDCFLFDDLCTEILSANLLKDNVFCLHKVRHADYIMQLKFVNCSK